MTTPINIDKVKALRNGNPYRHYATTEKEHHGAEFSSGKWTMLTHALNGSWLNDDGAPRPYDLVEAKTWRAWKEGEGPKFFMVRSKDDGLMLGLDRSKIDCFKNIFSAFDWLHEDGTTTPCGVCE